MFPDCLEKALIIPIPKLEQNTYTPSSFRPISLLFSLSKSTNTYWRIVGKCSSVLIQLLYPISLDLSPNSRRNTSLESDWTELVHESFLGKQKTSVVLVDIAKAFVRVCYFGIMWKLIVLNPHTPQLIFIFWNYHKVRTFSVKVNNSISSSLNIEVGVPQETWSVSGCWTYLLMIYPIFPASS